MARPEAPMPAGEYVPSAREMLEGLVEVAHQETLAYLVAQCERGGADPLDIICGLEALGGL